MMDGKPQIKGFREENLTPNGYDLTIAELILPASETSKTEGSLEIPPQTWFLVSAKEAILPGPRVAGDLWLRMTWAGEGVLPSFGKVHVPDARRVVPAREVWTERVVRRELHPRAISSTTKAKLT